MEQHQRNVRWCCEDPVICYCTVTAHFIIVDVYLQKNPGVQMNYSVRGAYLWFWGQLTEAGHEMYLLDAISFVECAYALHIL